ncbi:FCD domain-containing protein (plasmid) [Embleya sp. NBC_00888]|uniref:GntR family transcriptional regulator n=1 Tax=Embleya sp. NBC_00888 TaxID=2975960 RepID=UPI00386C7613|nr:FCD domain-containing protein [Embleya sp. NBC_00888]
MSKGVTTRGEVVFMAIREDILTGRLPPGSRLPFARLCERYDASMGVLREALSRLSEQNLVHVEPQQGYRVAPLSAEDLTDLTTARIHIESLALRESLAQGDLAWESRVIALHHTLARTPQSRPDDPARLTEAWTRAHAAFHAGILDGCANRRLRSIAAGLRDCAELYLHWSRLLGPDEDRDVAGEHRALLDAVLARDTDTAVDVLVRHIQRTTTTLLDSAAGNADLAGLGAEAGARPAPPRK